MKTQTLGQIQQEIARLQAQAEQMRQAEAAGVIARIKEAIAVYGFTAADLGLAPSGRKPAGKAIASGGAPKYRDPVSGKTWTGRGKPPLWITGAKDRSAFLIGDGSGADAPARAAPARGKARGGRKGSKTVGVAKYRDPQSGKTWTGVGKQPAWIAGVADRTPFEIGSQ